MNHLSLHYCIRQLPSLPLGWVVKLTPIHQLVSKVSHCKSNCLSSFTTTWPHLSSPYYATPRASHRSEVFKILSSNPSKMSVLDFVPTYVLKSCPALFSDLIAHLANLSFSKEVFPSKFKHDPSEPANNCPISNLNNISKIIERLFLTRRQSHIVSSPHFNSFQSAYRRYHSTETSLVHLLDTVYHAADDGLATLPLSLDLSAAFDTIDHSILLKRLSNSFGVMESAHNWLNSYLSGRSNSVKVGSSSSSVISSIYGVP